jgi:hypothetical protein
MGSGPKRRPAPAAPSAFMAVVADVHLGNRARFGGPTVDGLNDRGRNTVETFRRALRAARERGVAMFFVAGDLFDSRRPEPAVVAAAQAAIHEEAAGMVVVLVPGNHDMLDASALGGNTACAPLWREGEVVRAPGWHTVGGDALHVLTVPFDGTRPMADHLEDVLRSDLVRKERGIDRRILVTHVGVWDALGDPPWMAKAKDGIEAGRLAAAMKVAGIQEAYVGNFHEHRAWDLPADGVRIVQVGTLCPGSFGDAGMVDRGLMALAPGGATVEIPGPRFVVRSAGTPWPPRVPQGCWVYVRQVGGDPPAGDDGWDGYEHAPEPERLRAEAGGGVRPQAPTEEDAIRAHVEEMDVPAGVDRTRVLDLALDCWRRA